MELMLKIARENVIWGYDRIADALANVGHDISDQTVGNILKAHGIDPVPSRRRQMTWSTFLKAHWGQLAAVDFTTIEVWTKSGLTTFYLLFVMRLATRRVHFAGCTINPVGPWMAQIARNLTDVVDGPLREAGQYLLMDRDTKFTDEFRALLKSAGIAPGVTAAEEPQLQCAPRMVFQVSERGALERKIFFSEG